MLDWLLQLTAEVAVWDFLVYLAGQEGYTRTWVPILAWSVLLGCLIELAAGRPLRRLLPKDLHSVRTDLLLWLAGRPVTYALQILAPAVTLAAASSWLGDPSGRSPGPVVWALFGVLHFAFGEFVYWLLHWLRHRYGPLWAFHAVHHSADYLNPITSYRRHPVEAAILLTVINVGSSLPLVAMVLAFPGVNPHGLLFIAFANAVFLVTYFNLLHSHVWLSFGPVLEHVFISPAMHQIHHSRKMAETMSNYGQFLAVFDWLFGTLTLARDVDVNTLELGVDGVQHVTLWEIFILPFVEFWREIRTLVSR